MNIFTYWTDTQMQFQTTQLSICSVSMLLKHWLHSSWIVHHIDPVVPAFDSNGIVHCFRGFPASVTSIFSGFDQSWCAKPQQLWTKILHARHKQRIDSYRGPAAQFSSKDLEKFHWPGRNYGNNDRDKVAQSSLKCGCYALQTKVFNTLFRKL